MVKLSINDHIRTEMTTKGKIRQILPISPSTASIGEKVTIVVKTAKNTGVATCIAPFTAASTEFIPRSLNRAIFSPTTIASSTTIPKTRMNVNSDNIFMDKSNGPNSQNPPMNEIGIPSETQKANFGFKNNANTKITRMSPC